MSIKGRVVNVSYRMDFKSYNPSTMLSIAEDIDKNATIKSILYDTFTTRPLIDMKWLFFIILLLLISEWFIRKFNGNI